MLPLILKMKKMKIRNHQELLYKKRILKDAIAIQEDQIKDNIFTSTFSRFKNYNSKKKLLNFNSKNTQSNPRIEQGINLALTTLSTQLLKKKKLGIFPKLAIGVGVLLAGKIISDKISQYVDSNDPSVPNK